jgi:hypothetical protein
MKKLLIFHPQALFDANDLENYLYDSQAIRDDYLDMSPVNVISGVLSETKYSYSEWNIALKEGDDAHYWHICWCSETPFAFDDPYLLNLAAFEKAFRGTRAQCTIVIHKPKVTYVVYKMEAEVSDLLALHLADILGNVDNHTYTPEMAEWFGLGHDYLRHTIPVELEPLSGGRTHNGRAAEPLSVVD